MMEMEDIMQRTIDEIRIGDSAQVAKTITETDCYLYAGITGDFNPQHLDQEYAKTTIFNGRIVHGMLTAGLISRLLGMELPGMGSIYLSQECRFTAPVYFNDTITAKVEVVEIIENKRVKLSTRCFNQRNEMVLDGFAIVKPPKNKSEVR